MQETNAISSDRLCESCALFGVVTSLEWTLCTVEGYIFFRFIISFKMTVVAPDKRISLLFF